MACSFVRRLATTTSSFTNLLHHRPKAPSTTTTRSMGWKMILPPKEEQDLTVEGSTRYYDLNDPRVHPFQTAGELSPFRVDDVVIPTFKLIRIAMPGVEKKGCRYWIKDANHVVYFQGTAEDEHENEEEPRKYAGSVEFSPEVNHISGGVNLCYFEEMGGSEQKDKKTTKKGGYCSTIDVMGVRNES